MPTIVFASPKGGVGKTTSLLTLAGTIAHNGGNVIVIDADPMQHSFSWYERQETKKTNLTILPYPGEEKIIDVIEESEKNAQFVFVDLEGTANMLVAYAISRADLVIIPMQPSRMDASCAVKAIKLVKQQEVAFNTKIKAYVLQAITPPLVKTKLQKSLVSEFKDNGVSVFETELISRVAFKEADDYAVTLYDLPDNVSGVEAAIENAENFVLEVTNILKEVD